MITLYCNYGSILCNYGNVYCSVTMCNVYIYSFMKTPDVGLVLAHCLRCWHNTKTALDQSSLYNEGPLKLESDSAKSLFYLKVSLVIKPTSIIRDPLKRLMIIKCVLGCPVYVSNVYIAL